MACAVRPWQLPLAKPGLRVKGPVRSTLCIRGIYSPSHGFSFAHSELFTSLSPPGEAAVRAGEPGVGEGLGWAIAAGEGPFLVERADPWEDVGL